MSARWLGSSTVLFILTIASMGAVDPAIAQVAEGFEVPRTAYGHPDLQGNWTNVTLTPFERAEDRGPVYSPDEVAAIEQTTEDCPPNPGTVACGRNNTGSLRGQEYNEVYWDRGSRVARVRGEARASLLTRPADGRRPELTIEGRRLVETYRSADAGFGDYDHPEVRPLAERCIVSFGMSAGPPMVPNSAYNNNYTIVQTPDHVMILAEMVHDARIIRLGERRPLPPHVRPYFGDSWGRWEGDTLIVETTNLNPDHPFRGVPPTERTKVTERFTRYDEDTILYEFLIEDPTVYTEPWGGEIPFERFDDQVYEYSCHEGNYALSAVLSGARYQEREAAGDR